MPATSEAKRSAVAARWLTSLRPTTASVGTDVGRGSIIAGSRRDSSSAIVSFQTCPQVRSSTVTGRAP